MCPDEEKRKILRESLKNRSVVFANFSDAASKLFENFVGDYNNQNGPLKFDAVVVEDAGHLSFVQALQIACLGKKIILLGDYHQSVVRSHYFNEIDVIQAELSGLVSGTRKLSGTSHKSLLDAILNRFDPSAGMARLLFKKKNLNPTEQLKHSSHVSTVLVTLV